MALTPTFKYDIYVFSDTETPGEGGKATRQSAYNIAEVDVIGNVSMLINLIPASEHLQSVSVIRKIKYVDVV